MSSVSAPPAVAQGTSEEVRPLRTRRSAVRRLLDAVPYGSGHINETHAATYDERGGLWNPFTPADRDAIQRQVRSQLERAGNELGVAEHANRSAKTLLETLLATDGYTVDVSVQSRPIATPASR